MKLKFPILAKWTCLAGLTALVICLGACSGEGEKVAQQEAGAGEAKADVLTVFAWADYFPDGILDEFTRRTGTEIRLIDYETSDEMEARLLSASEDFDVVLTDDLSCSEVIERHLAAPIERARLPNFSNLDSGSLNRPWDRGNRHTVPYLWGTTLIAYNRDLISNPEQSWKLIWDKKVSKGLPIFFPDEGVDIVCAVSLSLGYPMIAPGEQALDAIFDRLEQATSAGQIQFAPYPQIRDALVSGESALSVIYSSDAAIAARENPKIAFFVPKEGAPAWMDSFLIVKSCPKPNLAHQLIDFFLEPEVGARCAKHNGGGTPNLAAARILEKDLLSESVGLSREELETRLSFTQELGLPSELMVRMAGVMRHGHVDHSGE